MSVVSCDGEQESAKSLFWLGFVIMAVGIVADVIASVVVIFRLRKL